MAENMLQIGPEFRFEYAPNLFSGRSGVGPLEVVWDTMILLDLFDYGASLMEGEDPSVDDEEYAAELDGLRLLIELWMVRDIRFRILQRSVDDSKKGRLSHERTVARTRALAQLTAALRLDLWTDEDESFPRRAHGWRASPEAIAAALRSVPEGADRELVAETLSIGAHVFLTRDKAILSAAPELSRCGVFIASPLDLLEELIACGAFHAVLDRSTVSWPLPDLQRLSHLLSVLPPT